MAHRIIIMHDKTEHAGGAAKAPAAESHRKALEEAVVQMAVVSPRIFKHVKAQMVRNLDVPGQMRELGDSQMFVLHALSKSKHLPSELARLHNVTNPTMSRIVDALVDRGYVERTQDPEDRRCIFLQLTEDGKKVGAYLDRRFRDAMQQFLSPLTEEQLIDIRRAYRHLGSLLPEGSTDTETSPVENKARGEASDQGEAEAGLAATSNNYTRN